MMKIDERATMSIGHASQQEILAGIGALEHMRACAQIQKIEVEAANV
jgi:hypothetical protein